MPYRYTQPVGYKKLRTYVLNRDDHRCYLCGADATQVDAVVPDSQGGSHEDEANLAAICSKCHEAKSEAERRTGFARRKPRVKRERPVEQHPGLIR